MSESTKERLVVACFILMMVAAVGCAIAVVLVKLLRQLFPLGCNRAEPIAALLSISPQAGPGAGHDSIVAGK